MAVRRIEDKDLERFVLKFTTVSAYAKRLDLPIFDTKGLLLANAVTPGLINKEKYLAMRKKLSLEKIAEYYQVSIYKLKRVCAEQKLNKKIDNLSKTELYNYWLQGFSVIELAERYGVSYQTMLNKINELKIPIKGRKRARVNEARVLKMTNEGKSPRDIARYFNCTIQAVHYYLRKNNA